MEPKTFRGMTLAEVERKVRSELGDDALVVRQREGLTGGVGGFFQRKLYEVDAIASPATPAAAPAVEPQDAAPAPPPPPPGRGSRRTRRPRRSRCPRPTSPRP